jgi:hypothetical protein
MFKKMTSLIPVLLVALTVFVGRPARAAGGSLVFICHAGLHYSMAEVKYAFKGYLDEPRPIDNKPLFKAMLDFIEYTPDRYTKTWDKMYFRRALFIPKMANSDAEVIKWVAASYGGVGYVSVAPKNNPSVEVCGL